MDRKEPMLHVQNYMKKEKSKTCYYIILPTALRIIAIKNCSLYTYLIPICFSSFFSFFYDNRIADKCKFIVSKVTW